MGDRMKKVLIAVYFFPPLGWSGVQRTLKFVKYLQEFGWEPIVVTVGESRFSIKDHSLGKEIPANISVIRIDDIMLKRYTDKMLDELMNFVHASFDIVDDETIKNAYIAHIESFMTQLRTALFFPDDQMAWANAVIDQLEHYVDLSDIDMIFTTGKPWSTHIIGYDIKKRYNKAWVADFRDEWTNNVYAEYDTNDIRYKMEYALEKKIVNYADIIVTTSSVSSDNYRNIFDLPYNKVRTITNGYDEEDFKDIEPVPTDKFTIVHNGAFYSVRTPYNFLKAVNNLIDKGKIDINNINVHFIGTCEDRIKAEIENMSANNYISWTSYLSHLESIKEASKANLLLLITGEKEKVKAMIPGKTFEYLRMGIPILSISPKGSAVADILEETQRGYNVENNDIETMEKIIYDYYCSWLNNVRFDYNKEVISKYERRKLTKDLANIFDELSHKK